MAKTEKPQVHSTKSGVHFVRPSDILKSDAGQIQIRKVASSEFYRSKPSNGNVFKATEQKRTR